MLHPWFDDTLNPTYTATTLSKSEVIDCYMKVVFPAEFKPRSWTVIFLHCIGY